MTPLIASAVSLTFSAPLFVTVNQVNRVPVSFCIANVLLIALANVGVLLAYPQPGAGEKRSLVGPGSTGVPGPYRSYEGSLGGLGPTGAPWVLQGLHGHLDQGPLHCVCEGSLGGRGPTGALWVLQELPGRLGLGPKFRAWGSASGPGFPGSAGPGAQLVLGLPHTQNRNPIAVV